MSSGPEEPFIRYYIICTQGDPITHLGVVEADQLVTGYSGYTLWSRDNVLDAIARGTEFATACREPDGEGAERLLRGERVRGVPYHAPRFLRTDANDELADNLGSLPTCDVKR